VQLYAFDVLAGDGEDYRRLPLTLRKASLARLLSREVNGIFRVRARRHRSGAVPPACKMGLEGIVSKRLDLAYGAGKCSHWLKFKNPEHAAFSRVRDKLLQSPRSRRSA